MTDEGPNAVAWHALETPTIATKLGTGLIGLTPEDVVARLEQYGPNQLAEDPPPSNLTFLIRQFRSPLIYILLVAVVITLALSEFIDAAVIAAVLCLNAIIGLSQERKAESAVRSLKRLLSPRAHVVRSGRDIEIDRRDLVVGDLVLLESGVRVPADIRLISTSALQVDESMLTGESGSVVKRVDPLAHDIIVADRRNMAYMGTGIASGRGRGYVVATGNRTELGAIAQQVREEDEMDTPLQQRLSRFAVLIGVGVGIASMIAFAIGIARGESTSQMFTIVVAMAVSAVPEGLPVASTITLAVGVRRMALRNAIIRRLPAVETLGSTTVIGSDKTGTLTENRMTVQRIWVAGRYIDLAPDQSSIQDDRHLADGIESTGDFEPLTHLLHAGVLPNEAHVYSSDEGPIVQGDPTDAALLVAASRFRSDPETVRAQYRVLEDIPFEPERQYAAVVCQDDRQTIAFVKGAPERVLSMCSEMLTTDGIAPINSDAVHRAARDLASDGLRVLGMASRALPDDTRQAREPWQPARMVFLGLVGMIDPPRVGVPEAIAKCQDSGIRVVMITGDHADTARVIATQLGIASSDAPVLTGVDIESLDDDELHERVLRVSIFARVAPEQKHRIVRALQAQGEVVAVTGDGVNDAPALKAADIGIAMGRSGTDVAREVADMILTDDNFVSVYAAVEEGRVTFDNLRKVAFFLLSTGVAEIIVIIAALSLGWPVPFLAAQILWLNLVTNGLQDIALAFEPAEPDVAERKPRARREGLLSRLLWERLLVTGIVMAAGTLLLFRWELDRSGSLATAQTVALTTMVVFQMFHVGNSRSERRSLFRMSPWSNPILIVATIAALAVHTAALYLPPTQYVLRVEPIGLTQWIRIGAVASTILIAIELHKRVRRH